MRIGILTTANSWHVPVKTKYFVSQNYEVFYFQLFPGTGQPIIPHGVTCIDIKSSMPGVLETINKLWKAYKYSRNMNLDVLHIIDMKYSYYSLFVKSKVKIIENNGSDVLVLPEKYKWLKVIYRLFYKNVDGVVQDSSVTQAAGIKCGAPTEHNEIVELGIDFKVFNENVNQGIARKILGLTDEKIVFSPRGFYELYNIDVIIKSIPLVIKSFPDVRYVFCRHSGKSATEFQSLIDELGVGSSILFTGFLDNETQLPFYYADSDIVVSIPSSDSSPRSVYEAMACYKPVIISELPWYHKKFLKNTNIIVIPVRDEIALAKAIINHFNNNLHIDLKSAYDFVMNNINMIDSSVKMERFYKKVIKSKEDYINNQNN